jgi:hypothetical protein
MPIGAAILGAGALGAGAQIYGASKAAGTQTQLGAAALAQQQSMFNTAQGALQPFISGGQAALPQLLGLEGAGPQGSAAIQNTLENLPGYQFSLTQGQRATTNALSAMGLGTSGPLARGLDQYTQGFAQNTFFPYLQALQNTASMGSGAAGTLGGQAVATGQSMGNTLAGIGNANAAATMTGANAIGNLAGSVPNALLMSRLLGTNSTNTLDTQTTNLVNNYANNYPTVDLGPQLGSYNPMLA